jgi:hypothetical protein
MKREHSRLGLWRGLALAVVFGVSSSAAFAAPIVLTTDFIPDGERDAFNGFEFAPATSDLAQPYIEDGIKLDAIPGANGDQGIWTTCTGLATACKAHEGNKSWYHNGGDFGYTQLTLASGADFWNVGMLVSSGFGSSVQYVNYATLLDGLVNGSGSFLLPGTLMYLGFSGGGFDEIWLSATLNTAASPNSNTFQALQLDSIETQAAAVPEPASLALLSLGAVAIRLRHRTRRRLS